jgi:hypothetical protein
LTSEQFVVEITPITPALSITAVNRIRRDESRKKKSLKPIVPDIDKPGTNAPEAQVIQHIDEIV